MKVFSLISYVNDANDANIISEGIFSDLASAKKAAKAVAYDYSYGNPSKIVWEKEGKFKFSGASDDGCFIITEHNLDSL